MTYMEAQQNYQSLTNVALWDDKLRQDLKIKLVSDLISNDWSDIYIFTAEILTSPFGTAKFIIAPIRYSLLNALEKYLQILDKAYQNQQNVWVETARIKIPIESDKFISVLTVIPVAQYEQLNSNK